MKKQQRSFKLAILNTVSYHSPSCPVPQPHHHHQNKVCNQASFPKDPHAGKGSESRNAKIPKLSSKEILPAASAIPWRVPAGVSAQHTRISPQTHRVLENYHGGLCQFSRTQISTSCASDFHATMNSKECYFQIKSFPMRAGQATSDIPCHTPVLCSSFPRCPIFNKQVATPLAVLS